MQKYAFLYINNERSEREIKEIIPFTITSKRIKYQEINLPQGTEELLFESCKKLRKKIKDDTNRWKDIPYSWIGRINIVKMTILSKVKVKVLVTRSCLALCNPMDCRPPGSSVHGILQTRIVESGPLPSSRGYS